MDASLFPEVQLEGADALLPVLGLACSKVAQKLEVCAEGADRHFTARIVERVFIAEIELGSILAFSAEGRVEADECHIAVLASDTSRLPVADRYAVEYGALEGLTCGFPLHDVGVACLDPLCLHKVERQCTCAGVETTALAIELHHCGIFKFRAREIVNTERQAKRVPFAILVESAAR